MESALDFQSAEVEKVKGECANIRQLIEHNKIDATLQAEKLEMYSRRECILVSGVEEVSGEDAEKLVMDIGKDVGVEISPADISACHRVGQKKRQQT